MRRLRRPAAIAAAMLFALQFLVLRSCAACAMPTAGGAGPSAAGMASMDMGGTSAPGTPVAVHGPGTQHTNGQRAPWHLPWAPANCNSMAACVSAIMTAQAVLLSVPPVTHDAVHLVVLRPASRSTPPELPPPRA